MGRGRGGWARLFLFCVLGLWGGGAGAVSVGPGVLSGSTTLSIAGYPLPCSTVDGIKLPTPCERAVFAWDVEVGINLRCTFQSMAAFVSTVFGIPGVEHVVAGLDGTWGGITIKPELVFSVPYETIVDVNNLPNTVIIPPGDFLFAQARLEASATLSGMTFRWIVVFQDLNFPNPGARFTPLPPPGDPVFYTAADQSFALGSLITLSSRVGDGASLSLQMALGATPGSFSVKKYSTYGKADPDAMYLTVSLTNIPFPCPWCLGPISNFRVGVSARIQPKSSPFISLTGSVGLTLFEKASVGTSFTLGITTGLKWGGIYVSIPSDFGTLNLQFDESGEFQSWSLNLSYRHQFSFGWTSGSCSASATAVPDRGVTSAAFGLALNHGLLTANYGLNYSWRSDTGLTFSALSTRFSLNLSPVVAGFGLTFGRGGLAMFAITVGYVF